jgi:hypothetical protein
MSDPHELSDDKLLAQLRKGLEESDPVPQEVTEFAKAAIDWRRIDAALAELAFDSLAPEHQAGVRSIATSRMLSFEAGRWTIDIEYSEAMQRLMGQVSPACQVLVELHYAGGAVGIHSDPSGRFDFDGVLPGPVSLVIRTPGDLEVVKTEWTVL